MGNSVQWREANKDKIAAYMREYYLAHSTRQRMIPGAERMEKRCRKCGVLKQRDEFTVRKSGPRTGHLAAHCKVCASEQHKQRFHKDPSYMNEISWRSKIKRRYGITPEDYDDMFESQGRCCAICGSTKSWSKNYKHKKDGSSRFMVDHCHVTGKVRGLLCTRCNRALGLLGDNVENFLRAVAYLQFHKA